MQNKATLPPIIIIGMHRSGTSMLTGMLEELGLFVGWKKDPNHEAFFFLQLNEWLLCQASGAWDNPEPMCYLLQYQEVRKLATDYLRYVLKTPRVVSYLGWGKYLRYRSLFNLDIPWGWKDPRNTFTLPIWLDLFPEAKVIHIYRNGVDVANSLKVRSEKELKWSGRWMKQHMWRHSFLKHPFLKFVSSIKCLSLKEGFNLWETYTSLADHYMATLPADRAMSIRYEDFLKNVSRYLKSMCAFIGISSERERIARMQSKVRLTRSKAYEQENISQEFYRSVKNSSQMRRYCY